MTYFKFLKELRSYAEEKLADFHTPLLNSKTQKILGVRMPVLRKIAKSKVGEVEELFSYPDEYHEVTLLKLLSVSYLPYEKFLAYADRAVSLISNWAQCDCFKANCIKNLLIEYYSQVLQFLPYQ